MGVVIRGESLSQQQLDALVPVLNNNMRTPMRFNKFEKACVEALENAGVPLQHVGLRVGDLVTSLDEKTKVFKVSSLDEEAKTATLDAYVDGKWVGTGSHSLDDVKEKFSLPTRLTFVDDSSGPGGPDRAPTVWVKWGRYCKGAKNSVAIELWGEDGPWSRATVNHLDVKLPHGTVLVEGEYGDMTGVLMRNGIILGDPVNVSSSDGKQLRAFKLSDAAMVMSGLAEEKALKPPKRKSSSPTM